jgi:hypothetical protein
MEEYRIPQVVLNHLWFGMFAVPIHEVIDYTDDKILLQRGDSYIVYEFTDKDYPTARWQCVEITTKWLTIVEKHV